MDQGWRPKTEDNLGLVVCPPAVTVVGSLDSLLLAPLAFAVVLKAFSAEMTCLVYTKLAADWFASDTATYEMGALWSAVV